MPPSRRLEPGPVPGYPKIQHFMPARSHGGAWKVAYADFVTALMCLFIVLWLTSSTQAVKQSISGYFQDPKGYTAKMEAGAANPETSINDLRRVLEQAIQQIPEFEKLEKNVKFSVTGEGLRIDLMENAQGTFFEAGGAKPSLEGEKLLRVLAGEIGKMPNRLAIEGHSDAQAYRNSAPDSGYTNWELSADRANAARRLLHASGIRPGQVGEVRGFADQKLLNASEPGDPRNRRVSVVVKFE
jgi:chemotaxis protein MotB